MKRPLKKTCRRRQRRKGAATVELALSIPVILLLVFGSIEACNLVHLKQTVTSAAYQGAVQGMKPGATEENVFSRVNAVLAARGITNTSVSADLDETQAGNTFKIQVTAKTAGNSIGINLLTVFEKVEVTLYARKQ